MSPAPNISINENVNNTDSTSNNNTETETVQMERQLNSASSDSRSFPQATKSALMELELQLCNPVEEVRLQQQQRQTSSVDENGQGGQTFPWGKCVMGCRPSGNTPVTILSCLHVVCSDECRKIFSKEHDLDHRCEICHARLTEEDMMMMTDKRSEIIPNKEFPKKAELTLDSVQFICDFCIHDNPAVKFCPDCPTPLCLCEECAKLHNDLKVSREHVVVPIPQRKKEERLKLMKEKLSRCSTHGGSILTHYCSTCDAKICEGCLPGHEGDSHEVFSIKEEKDKLVAQLNIARDLKMKFVELTKSLVDKISDTCTTEWNKVMTDISKQLLQIMAALFHFEKQVQQKAKVKFMQTVWELKTDLKQVEISQNALDDVINAGEETLSGLDESATTKFLRHSEHYFKWIQDFNKGLPKGMEEITQKKYHFEVIRPTFNEIKAALAKLCDIKYNFQREEEENEEGKEETSFSSETPKESNQEKASSKNETNSSLKTKQGTKCKTTKRATNCVQNYHGKNKKKIGNENESIGTPDNDKDTIQVTDEEESLMEGTIKGVREIETKTFAEVAIQLGEEELKLTMSNEKKDSSVQTTDLIILSTSTTNKEETCFENKEIQTEMVQIEEGLRNADEICSVPAQTEVVENFENNSDNSSACANQVISALNNSPQTESLLSLNETESDEPATSTEPASTIGTEEERDKEDYETEILNIIHYSNSNGTNSGQSSSTTMQTTAVNQPHEEEETETTSQSQSQQPPHLKQRANKRKMNGHEEQSVIALPGTTSSSSSLGTEGSNRLPKVPRLQLNQTGMTSRSPPIVENGLPASLALVPTATSSTVAVAQNGSTSKSDKVQRQTGSNKNPFLPFLSFSQLAALIDNNRDPKKFPEATACSLETPPYVDDYFPFRANAKMKANPSSSSGRDTVCSICLTGGSRPTRDCSVSSRTFHLICHMPALKTADDPQMNWKCSYETSEAAFDYAIRQLRRRSSEGLQTYNTKVRLDKDPENPEYVTACRFLMRIYAINESMTVRWKFPACYLEKYGTVPYNLKYIRERLCLKKHKNIMFKHEAEMLLALRQMFIQAFLYYKNSEKNKQYYQNVVNCFKEFLPLAEKYYPGSGILFNGCLEEEEGGNL